MSVIGEVVGIVACVAGVISAYHDGGAIIQKIKLKRAARRAPAPPRLLEESIDQAPSEIEREKQRGIARFGKAFENGDHIAVIALQSITIQLQGSLLEKLRNDDENTDFMFLVDAADTGRDGTIRSLLELRQRLLAERPISEVGSPRLEQQRTKSIGSPAIDLPIHSAHSPEIEAAKSRKTWTRDVGGEEEEEATIAGADESATPTPGARKRNRSILGFFKHHRPHSNSGDKSPRIEEIPQPVTSPTSMTPSSPRATRKESRSQQPPESSPRNFQYQDWEDDPAAIWGAPKSDHPERRDTVASLAVPPDVNPTTSSSPTSPKPSNRSLSVVTTSGPTSIATPTPENDYLGFCKSAYKLQNGDRKALVKAKEFNDGWSQSAVYYLCCASSKCAFAGHISMDKIWTKVWTVEARGLKFRWPFLAKSHVAQQKVKEHQYGYQCLFCVFGGEKGAVYFGTDMYLEHVSTHRGQALSEVVVYKSQAIVDRIVEVDEHDGTEFDINLFPLTTKEENQRKRSEVLSDELLEYVEAKRKQEEDDKTFSNEPWNAGLSEFHYGEMERAELE
ncbi:hypothetical protein LTR86_009451 [Recurvomyces mirabilis]|nr:hypothetical protein LTR86_009451 [Recurvomyces mirabilis]